MQDDTQRDWRCYGCEGTSLESLDLDYNNIQFNQYGSLATHMWLILYFFLFTLLWCHHYVVRVCTLPNAIYYFVKFIINSKMDLVENKYLSVLWVSSFGALNLFHLMDIVHSKITTPTNCHLFSYFLAPMFLCSEMIIIIPSSLPPPPPKQLVFRFNIIVWNLSKTVWCWFVCIKRTIIFFAWKYLILMCCYVILSMLRKCGGVRTKKNKRESWWILKLWWSVTAVRLLSTVWDHSFPEWVQL